MNEKTSTMSAASGAPRKSRAPGTSALSLNLLAMNSPMMKLLQTESVGGNAGRAKLDGKYYACAAANGYADPQSGRIVAFGNFQDVSPNIRKKNAQFTLRVACGVRGFFRIVQLVSEDRGSGGTLSPGARDVLEQSVRTWNKARER